MFPQFASSTTSWEGHLGGAAAGIAGFPFGLCGRLFLPCGPLFSFSRCLGDAYPVFVK